MTPEEWKGTRPEGCSCITVCDYDENGISRVRHIHIACDLCVPPYPPKEPVKPDILEGTDMTHHTPLHPSDWGNAR